MAVGLPVIAANWGGPADYVGDDGSGILVEPSTHQSFVTNLTGAMAKLAGSREARVAMSRAARHRAVTVFDWEARVDRLLEVYRETIERSSSPSSSSFRNKVSSNGEAHVSPSLRPTPPATHSRRRGTSDNYPVATTSRPIAPLASSRPA
jgi:hypothetical protein